MNAEEVRATAEAYFKTASTQLMSDEEINITAEKYFITVLGFVADDYSEDKLTFADSYFNAKSYATEKVINHRKSGDITGYDALRILSMMFDMIYDFFID